MTSVLIRAEERDDTTFCPPMEQLKLSHRSYIYQQKGQHSTNTEAGAAKKQSLMT